jgi:hypothetical protein
MRASRRLDGDWPQSLPSVGKEAFATARLRSVLIVSEVALSVALRSVGAAGMRVKDRIDMLSRKFLACSEAAGDVPA